MVRISVRTRLQLAQPGPVLLQLAAAGRPTAESIQAGGHLTELTDRYGARHHRFEAPAGPLEVSYSAGAGPTPPPDLGELDRLEMLRPSRFCPSDLLRELPVTRLADVEDWVHERLSYVIGSGGPTEDALQTLERGSGVCRDFAHVVVTICRALEVPARVFSAYAPGLEPEDFHLVAEAWTGDAWHTIDATRLVDPTGLVRISTGRDAADTAWLTTYGPHAELQELTVRVS